MGGSSFELWPRFPQNWGVPHPHVLHFWKGRGEGYEAYKFCGPKFRNNPLGGAKLSKSAKITHSGSIWGFITPNLLRQPHNAIHHWKGL